MEKLTKQQFDKAVQYLKTQAQDIDRVMFEYFFEHRSVEDVLAVLGSYQNEDGGFGLLEYDMQFPHSCLKNTENACRYLFDLQEIPGDTPMIHKLISYLVKNFNMDTGMWNNITVPDGNNYPHAPWWEHEDEEKYVPKNRAELVEHYNPNTNAALAGMFVKYPSLVPDEIFDQATNVVIEKINSADIEQYGMMSCVYFVNAWKDENVKNSLRKKLMGDGNLISILDEEWGTESAYKLCHWIDSPKHSYYALYQEAVTNNLDFIVRSQQEDGAWLPSWSWGDAKVWELAVRRLKGLMTFKFLLALKRFGRIEGLFSD
ncbi:MAG: hypothetical protein K2O03_09510 [Lachnospiraceae bacterium]|nr:hypothetical protein [Lachnospiraceae bacterium]